jgi:TrmH family RNA methyltransferase
VKHITSRDNPLFKELVKLSGSARQRRKAGQALLDGVHLLDAYLAAGQLPLQLIATPDALQDAEVAALLQRIPAVPMTLLDDVLFAGLSELKTPSGILALIQQPAPHTSVAHSRFALLLEDIQDPGNLGSMIRSAAAAGCDAVFLSKGCADAWSPKVLRAGMGGHFALSIHESADLPLAASIFQGEVYAAALQAQRELYACDLRGSVAFAIGNEGGGLSAALLDACEPFRIPMPGQSESLNAAAAAAVCLFEAVRQQHH